MRRTNEADAKEKRSCLTCEANAVCQWVRGIAKSDRDNWICREYTNSKLGYFRDQLQNRRIEE